MSNDDEMQATYPPKCPKHETKDPLCDACAGPGRYITIKDAGRSIFSFMPQIGELDEVVSTVNEQAMKPTPALEYAYEVAASSGPMRMVRLHQRLPGSPCIEGCDQKEGHSGPCRVVRLATEEVRQMTELETIQALAAELVEELESGNERVQQALGYHPMDIILDRGADDVESALHLARILVTKIARLQPKRDSDPE